MDRLLRPKSIAVIGGGTWCENVIDACRRTGFQGALSAVHPTRREVAGVNAVPSLADLPAPPDAAFIGVNRNRTVEIVRALREAGAGGAVCFAAGFSEAVREMSDGAELQSALVEAAGEMPILGPNCYGFINALDSAALWPDQHGLARVDTGVAILSQSSNIALNLTMQARGLPIAYLITVGNQAQIGLSAIGSALLDDPRVTAIALHIEGIDDLAAFEVFARKAHQKGKPVVALKVGRSEAAQAATASHTAALAGSAAGASALFRRLGIAEVRSLAGMLEALKLLHVNGPLPSSTVASMSCSGGEASLMADAALATGVTYPPLSGDQEARLRDALGPNIALANPLDYNTFIWGDVDAMARTFAAMVAGEAAIGVVVLDIPRADRCAPEAWYPTLDAIRQARAMTDTPIAVLASLPETMPEALAADLIAEGIVPFAEVNAALEAISAASALALAETPVFIPEPVPNPRALTEADAKARLAPFGLRIPQNARANNPDEAVAAARSIGYPVVLKGTGPLHKTEAGAVALNLTSDEAVAKAAEAMPVDAFLVEEMVTGTLAELLVGVVHDPAHGLVLTLAAGGILTELLEDSVSFILPVSESEIRAGLDHLRYARVLNGYRGAPPIDREALAKAVLAVQSFAMATPVAEIEINPLLCGADFAIAADALISCGDADGG